MNAWRDDFERRCREVLEVPEQTQSVLVGIDSFTLGNTCHHYILLQAGSRSREFRDVDELLDALEAVSEASHLTHVHGPVYDREARKVDG